MNLKPELLEALKSMAFNTMTDVQEHSIPIILEHKDIVVRSKTGSGKTAAFLVPIFQNMTRKGHPQALVVVPTRELAKQIFTVAVKLAHGGKIRASMVYGGASINVQISILSGGVDIVIGTPGRLKDLVERGALRLENVSTLVLDEADMMLDMGFIEDIEWIMSKTKRDRQTILLSATMPRAITDIAKRYMKPNFATISIGEEEGMVVNTITHHYAIANRREKFATLYAYIDKFQPKKCIIFAATQRESELIHQFLVSNGLDAILMHGGLTQQKREKSLHSFRTHARFLISTNLASRGLDIPDTTDIINFDAPNDVETYVHRVGRSARMGRDGRAFTIFYYDERNMLHGIERVAGVKMNNVALDISKYQNLKLPFSNTGGERSGRGGSFHRFGERREGGSRYGGGRREGSSRYGGGGYGRRPFHSGGGHEGSGRRRGGFRSRSY
jgi:ATP-dependent RNA helicase DeaD